MGLIAAESIGDLLSVVEKACLIGCICLFLEALLLTPAMDIHTHIIYYVSERHGSIPHIPPAALPLALQCFFHHRIGSCAHCIMSLVSVTCNAGSIG